MKVKIQILKDDGTLIDEQEGSLFQPKSMRTHQEHPFTDGNYSFFGYSWVPITKLRLPPSR